MSGWRTATKRPLHRLLALTGVVALVAAAMVRASVMPARADDAGTDSPPACASTTYTYTGSSHQCIVPAGVTSVSIDAVGGQGGTTTDDVAGGLGGRVVATLSVSAGDVLTLVVGGSGGGSGGFGGSHGGDPGAGPYVSSFDGAGGGGSTDVRLGTRTLVTAGGGGGGGGGSEIPVGGGVGGQGGTGMLYHGPDGVPFAAPGATGSGYEGHGGRGGCGSCRDGNGTDGGSSSDRDGGGGGGGGGGGHVSGAGGGGGGFGGAGGGGGGGLSYVDPLATAVTFSVATQTGHGSVSLTFAGSAPEGDASLPLGAPAPVSPAGDPVVFSQPGRHAWTVPAGVNAITVEAHGGWGGSPGGDGDGNGGLGDGVTATVEVTPGEVLEVVVGAEGDNGRTEGDGRGGSHGTTSGSNDNDSASAGGGGSSVSRGTERLVVAGGGGGAGSGSTGAGIGGNGGTAGVSPDPGRFGVDTTQNAGWGEGGGGGAHPESDGGGGTDNGSFSGGAGGGGGGGYALHGMGGGGEGGGSPDGDGNTGGGGGGGGGGGRSYVEPGAREVSFGRFSSTEGGSVTITPAHGRLLTVTSGDDQSAYPGQLFQFVNMQVTDVFGRPVEGVEVTATVPQDAAKFWQSPCTPDTTTCRIQTDRFGNAQFPVQASQPPWTPGPFTMSVTSPGLTTVPVGLTGLLLPTTTTVTSSTPTGQSGDEDAVRFTATVAQPTNPYAPGPNLFPTATGSVTFTIDGQPLPGGAVPLDASGAATTPAIDDLAVGAHEVEVAYTGDAAHQLFAPSGGRFTQTVVEYGSAVSVSSSSNPVAPDGSVTFSATVTTEAADLVPTGSVQFQTNGVDLGAPVPLPAQAPLTVNSPTVQLPAASLHGGANTVTATYSGDERFASSSRALTQSVQVPAAVTLTSCFMSAGAGADCAGPAVRGMALVVTATGLGDHPAPSGTVQFFVDGVSFGAPVALAEQLPPVSSAASAELDQDRGERVFEARYSGDDTYAPATVVVHGPLYEYRSVLSLTSSYNPVLPTTPGTDLTLSANAPQGGVQSGGTVVMYDGGDVISERIPLQNQRAVLADQGSCELGPGVSHITAEYSGDPDYILTPNSASLAQTVLSVCLDEPGAEQPPEPSGPPHAAPDGDGRGSNDDTLAVSGVEWNPALPFTAVAALAGGVILLVAAARRGRLR